MKLKDDSAFYLEFSVEPPEQNYIQQLFVLKDNARLSARNLSYFSRSHSAITCNLNSPDDTLHFSPAKQRYRAIKQAFSGHIFGVRLRAGSPNPYPLLSKSQHRNVFKHCRHAANALDLREIHTCLCILADSVHSSLINCFGEQQHSIEEKHSERTLRRHNKRNSGLSPLQQQRVTKDSQALHALLESEDSISTLALNHGYSDQAHFNRRFQRFSGSSPARFQKRWKHDKTVQIIQELQALPGLTFGMLIE